MGTRALARTRPALVDAHGHDIEILDKEEPAKVAVLATPDLSPEALISRAIDKGVPIDVIERLMVMRREMIAERAKAAFFASLKAFQQECPVIKPTKSVSTRAGVKAYSYAPFDVIVQIAKPYLDKHGFTYQFQTEPNENGVTRVCIATHIGGHSERAVVSVPFGGKTDIMSASQHAIAAATFAARYAFRDVFGIATGDADTDAGKGTEPKYKVEKKNAEENRAPAGGSRETAESKAGPVITKAQQETLFVAVQNSGRNEKSIGAWLKTKYGATSSAVILQSDYKEILEAIKAPGALKV